MNKEQKKQTLLFWQLAVEGMDVLDIPEGQTYKSFYKEGTYKRFTGFVKEYAERIFFNYDTGIANVDHDVDRKSFPDCDKSGFTRSWWKSAIAFEEGKNEEKKDLPLLENPTKEDKNVIYDMFMPVYSALNESFGKRHWYDWIINHTKYVAERDTLKALRGLMMAITGDNKEDVAAALDSYSNEVEGSGVSRSERKEMLRAKRLERKKGTPTESLGTDRNAELENDDMEIKFNPNEQTKAINHVNDNDFFEPEDIENFEDIVEDIDLKDFINVQIGEDGEIAFTEEEVTLNRTTPRKDKKESEKIEAEPKSDELSIIDEEGELIEDSVDESDNRSRLIIDESEVNDSINSTEVSERYDDPSKSIKEMQI